MSKQRKIDHIILHCSDSNYGNADLINRWHRAHGWRGIGYHFVILNGYPNEESHRTRRPQFWLDGVVEEGRPLENIGAHARGFNRNSIGICLIGKEQFTQMQFEALLELVGKFRQQHGNCALHGHYELLRPDDPPKTCPNIDMEWLRGLID